MKFLMKLFDLYYEKGLTKEEVERTWGRESFSHYLTVEAYDPETNLYLTCDGYVCGIFECFPKIMVGEESIQCFIDLYAGTVLPQKSIVQTILIGDTYVEPLINKFVNLRYSRGTEIDPTAKVWLEDYSRFILENKFKEISDVIEVPTRNFRLFVVYKIPCSPEEYKSRPYYYSQIHRSVKNSLESNYFFPIEILPEQYIKLMYTLINPAYDPNFREYYDPHLPIYNQIVEGNNIIKIGRDYIVLGDCYGKAITVKAYPSSVAFTDTITFMGDIMKNKLQIHTPFMLTANFIIPDEKVLINLYKKIEFLDRQKAASSLSAKLLQRQEEAAWIMKNIEEKKRLVQGYLSWWIFSPDLDSVNKCAQTIKSILNLRGYKGQEELGSVNLLLFSQALPGNASEEVIYKVVKRAKTMFDFNAANLTPVTGDWKGTGTPVVPFISRRGQIMFFNFFDGSEGYNACIAARTGSGKSFLTNHIVSAYHSLPDVSNIWIIDVGESYKATALLKGGTYIDFSEEADIQINPFTLTSEASFNEDFDIILKIVSKMAKPTEGVNDTEKAILDFAIRNAFSKYGKNTNVDRIVEELNVIAAESTEDIKKDTASLLATNLYRWTTAGTYGKFVNRGTNINVFNKLTILELRHLKQKPDLKTVMLMLIFYAVIKVVMLDDDRTKKKILIFDEAWQFLDDLQTAKFIEEAYRTFRKHGACIISITQGIQDFYQNPHTKAMFFQASYVLLLAQKPENIQLLKKEEHLVLSEYEYQLLNSLRTVKGVYSEIFFITPVGRGVGRLIVPPLSYWQYTSDANDVALRTKMIEQYGVEEGLKKCVEYSRSKGETN